MGSLVLCSRKFGVPDYLSNHSGVVYRKVRIKVDLSFVVTSAN